MPASISTEGFEGFCEEFASEIQADWPDIDSATAASLGSVVSAWASNPELSSVSADLQTIATWLTTAATATTVAGPPPDVTTAFNNIAAFADTNC